MHPPNKVTAVKKLTMNSILSLEKDLEELMTIPIIVLSFNKLALPEFL